MLRHVGYKKTLVFLTTVHTCMLIIVKRALNFDAIKAFASQNSENVPRATIV